MVILGSHKSMTNIWTMHRMACTCNVFDDYSLKIENVLSSVLTVMLEVAFQHIR